MEPSISNQKLPKWQKVLVFWIGPALLVLAIGLSCFKQCTDLGRAADTDVYDPQENGVGFVTKANQGTWNSACLLPRLPVRGTNTGLSSPTGVTCLSFLTVW